ncbi:hypothetical protein HanHA300_Chr13g0504751 [Helianthus annuus]|nr:hypothetical protein HanHA300_Chr13g0504751 [Helianthus annuus]KAJ0847431.1 hypothetical protein HanPSC8_Chr13g0545251 [Helianthus annuus]
MGLSDVYGLELFRKSGCGLILGISGEFFGVTKDGIWGFVQESWQLGSVVTTGRVCRRVWVGMVCMIRGLLSLLLRDEGWGVLLLCLQYGYGTLGLGCGAWRSFGNYFMMSSGIMGILRDGCGILGLVGMQGVSLEIGLQMLLMNDWVGLFCYGCIKVIRYGIWGMLIWVWLKASYMGLDVMEDTRERAANLEDCSNEEFLFFKFLVMFEHPFC